MKNQYILTLILLATSVFFGYKYYQEKELNQNLMESKNFEFSWDPSGEVLFGKWANNKKLSNAFYDRNFDNNYELNKQYDIYGNLYQNCYDLNENGVFEKFEVFNAYSKKIGTNFDRNEDGAIDEFTITLLKENRINFIDTNHDGIWEDIFIISPSDEKSKINIEDLLK